MQKIALGIFLGLFLVTTAWASKMPDKKQLGTNTFVSQRAEHAKNDSSSYDSYGRPTDRPARDTNAGTYHVVTTNYLGNVVPVPDTPSIPNTNVHRAEERDADLDNKPPDSGRVVPENMDRAGLERDLEGREIRNLESTREPLREPSPESKPAAEHAEQEHPSMSESSSHSSH